MRIALINPKGTIFSNNKEMSTFLEKTISMDSFRHFWSAPCLGLLTIAAYFPDNWDVDYIDEVYREIDFNLHYDFICISAMTIQANRAYQIAEKFRKKSVLTVIGGIHCTLLPNAAGKYVDVVLAGEGEVLFPKFLEDYRKGRVKKLYQSTSKDPFDLKNCIMPRYDLIKYYDYPIVNVYTTRGCPRKCNFCCASNVYGVKYRRKSNEQILKEIDEIVKLYPDKLILFADDNFFVLRNETKLFLNELREKNIRWIAQTDITISNDESLLKLMYQSGCQWIVIGLESISEKSLQTIEAINFKQKHLNKYKEDIQKIQSYGINIYGTFIVGLDEDGSDIFEHTAQFILDAKLYGVNITVPTPLPGTKLRQQMEAEKRIISYDWSDYTLWDVVIRPKHMNKSELEIGLLNLYKKISNKHNSDKRLKSLLNDIRQRKKLEKGVD